MCRIDNIRNVFLVFWFVCLFARLVQEKNSVENYYKNFDLAVQILHDNLTRTIVNLVPMFDVTPVANFSTGLACDYLQWRVISCFKLCLGLII